MTAGQTLTDRTRKLLDDDTSMEFTISRVALETLVSDSERYGLMNGRLTGAVVSAREAGKGIFSLVDREWNNALIARLESIAAPDANGKLS